MFNFGEIATFRQMTENSMVERCALIYGDAGYVSTGNGRGTYTPPSRIEQVPFRRAPLGSSPNEQQMADRLQSSSLVNVFLPIGTDIINLDAVEIGGQTYPIKGIHPLATFAGHRVVIVEEVVHA